MIRTLLTTAAAGMLISAGALAQDNSNAKQTETPTTESSATATPQNGKTMGLRQEMRDSLQQAGFTNVRVMPDSFLVQAKDKGGHPVAMIINPHSMTEVVDEGTVGQNASNQDASGQQTADNSAGQKATFTTVPPQEKLSSAIVGLSVYNDQKQDIGTIKDIAYTRAGVKAYILGVGGFLGVGDHYVAVQPGAVKITWDNNSKAWHAAVDTNADQLKSAPEYTYPTQGG
jgi:hypothetical protein